MVQQGRIQTDGGSTSTQTAPGTGTKPSESFFGSMLELLTFPEEALGAPAYEGRDEVERRFPPKSRTEALVASRDRAAAGESWSISEITSPESSQPVPTESRQEDSLSFEQVMEFVAFPERHLPKALTAFSAGSLLGGPTVATVAREDSVATEKEKVETAEAEGNEKVIVVAREPDANASETSARAGASLDTANVEPAEAEDLESVDLAEGEDLQMFEKLEGRKDSGTHASGEMESSAATAMLAANGDGSKNIPPEHATSETSKFDEVMNYVAFPERHVPKVLAVLKARVGATGGRDSGPSTKADEALSPRSAGPVNPSDSARDEAEIDTSPTFEKVMDVVAYPEKSIPVAVYSCSAAIDENVLETIAFPEKHVPGVATAIEGGGFLAKRLSSFTSRLKIRGLKKSKGDEKPDILDDVFEDAEARFCVPHDGSMEDFLATEDDTLDFVFDNVESAVCKGDRTLEVGYLLPNSARNNTSAPSGVELSSATVEVAPSSHQASPNESGTPSNPDVPRHNSLVTESDKEVQEKDTSSTERGTAVSDSQDGTADLAKAVMESSPSSAKAASPSEAVNPVSDPSLASDQDTSLSSDPLLVRYSDILNQYGIRRDRSLISESTVSSFDVSLGDLSGLSDAVRSDPGADNLSKLRDVNLSQRPLRPNLLTRLSRSFNGRGSSRRLTSKKGSESKRSSRQLKSVT